MAACPRCASPLESGARFCARCGAPSAGAADPTQRDMTQTPMPAADPLIGRQVIGQYVIRKKLGEGGMGAVYVADQPSVGRTAVIKVLHPHFSRDPQMAPRFEIEARAAARMQNPHIVAIYNYGDMGDGTLFLAMEHLEGRSLDDAIRADGRIAPPRAVRIAVQCCDALGEAHRAGIVHRDLKPPNIMLVRRGRDLDFVKVLDFGIAKLEGVKMTATGAVFGTPQYMSPEQLRGEALDGRSDIYSLAVILFEMLTGQLPFKSQTPAGFMHKHLSEPPPAMRVLDPRLDVPAAIEAAVQHALAKDPAARPQSAAPFAEELEAAVTGRMAAALSPTASAPVAVGAVPTVEPVGRSTRRSRTLRVRAAYAIGGLLAAGVATTAFVMREHWHPQRLQAPGGADAAAHSGGPGVVRLGAAIAHGPPADAAPAGQTVLPTVPVGPTVPNGPSGKVPGRKITKLPKPPPVPHIPVPETGPTQVPANPTVPAGGSTPPIALSPETEALLGRSLPELEAELRRVVAHSRLPPSSIKQVFDSYALMSRSMNEDQPKTYLVQPIVDYRKPELRLQPGEEKSVKELTAIFMSMKTKNPMTDETRKQILANVMKGWDESTVAPEDKEFYKRTGLAGLIKSYAEDPSVLGGHKKSD